MSKPTLGTTLSTTDAMDLAVELAYLGGNRVSPNPHVGCVVLDKSYKLISFGKHEYFGGPHAEVNALKHIPPHDLEGAHVFVSLEPCSHHGKTPPCADFLANLPIESLTYGVQDPNPEVAGKGLDLIRSKGIRVNPFDRHSEELEDLLLTFKHHLQNKEAFIALKIATSLDGAIADKNQKSQWITSEASREHVHFLRSRYHAVLIGKKTLLADDPMLNTRHDSFPEHTNRVIVLNANLDLLPMIVEKKIYKTRKPQDVILVANKSNVGNLELMKDDIYRDPKSGVIVLAVDMLGNSLHLKQMKQKLISLQIFDVMVEGGGETFSHFMEQQAFDHIYLFQAPMVIGASSSKMWSANISRTLENRIDLEIKSVKKLGSDLLLQISRK